MKKKKRRSLLSLMMVLAMLVTFMPQAATMSYAAGEPVVRETDVSNPASGNEIVLLKGEYKYLAKADILARINEIRLEACREGVKDPRNPSRSLTEADYVPLKWSSDLEWIAQLRAAEATVHMDHVRPNGGSCNGVIHNGIKSSAEDLAWNSGADILGGINQWYKEKSDWVNNTGAVTGHYTSMINPGFTYVGIGAFKPAGYGAVAGELSSKSSLDETQADPTGVCLQKVEVRKSNISIAAAKDATVHVGKTADMGIATTTSYANNLGSYWSPKVSKVILSGSVTYSSSAQNTATVDDNGIVTGVSAGTATVTATFNGTPYTSSVTVEDHDWRVQVPSTASCTEDGVTKYKCSKCTATKEEPVKATGHQLTHYPAKEATAKKAGNTEYWKCGKCGRIFRDANGTQEISIEDTVIPAKTEDGTDDPAAAAVDDLISKLPDAAALTLADEPTVKSARTAYEKLTADQRAKVTGLSKLEALEKKIDQLKANEVRKLIDAIPSVVTEDDSDTVDRARDAYDALTTDQKNLIDASTFKKLTDAENVIGTDSRRASAVARAIDDLPWFVEPADEDDVKAAREAYDSLTPDQKKLIYDDLVDKLEKLEKDLELWKDFYSEGAAVEKIRAKISSVKAGKGGKVKISWKKVSAADGYQIRYSTDRRFKKSVKKVKVKGANTLRKVIKLRIGKKNYVQVRTYKKVRNEATGDTITFYGKWSKTKSVKVR